MVIYTIDYFYRVLDETISEVNERHEEHVGVLACLVPQIELSVSIFYMTLTNYKRPKLTF